MVQQNQKDVRFSFDSSGLEVGQALQVVHFEGEEALSTLFKFDITLISESPDLDLVKILHGTASLTIRSVSGTRQARYHGVLSSFAQREQLSGHYVYQAVLVPRISRLQLEKTTEVYIEDQPITKTLETILKDHGFSYIDYRFAIKDASVYRNRSLVIQHQETTLDFMNRWLEKEGLYFHFEHPDEGPEQLQISDFKESLEPEKKREAQFIQTANLTPLLLDDAVTQLNCRQKKLPKKVIVQDFNFRKASLGNGLKAEASVDDANGHGEVRILGENLRDEKEAQRMAKIRSELIQSESEVYDGESTAVGIRSGYRLVLEGHFRQSFNRTYTVSAVKHQGSQAQALQIGLKDPWPGLDYHLGSHYHVRFTALPSDQQYRPPLMTVRPSIVGMLPGVIDGSGNGNQPEIDQYGQYKVQFLFDKTDKHAAKGSSWIRMATPYAGSKNGMNFPLLKGTEVLIGFSYGDPDQPVILGAVQNSENPSVVTSKNNSLNGIKTVSGNGINLSDVQGASGVMINTGNGASFIYMGDGNSKGVTPQQDSELITGIADLVNKQ